MASRAAFFVLVAVCSLTASACGSGNDRSHVKRTHVDKRTSVPATPGPLRARPAGLLPYPVQFPAAALLPDGTLLVMGGLDSADVSVPTIVAVQLSQASVVGQLPQPVHDAAAVALGRRAYMFGGGTGETGTDAIVEVDPAGGATEVDRLPMPASDVGAAVVGSTAYVVGGYTGTTELRSIVAYRRGSGARLAARLPVPLRYPAVAAVDGRVLIAGGTTGVAPQRGIFSFDPGTGRVTRIGQLPNPLTHAAGASLNGAFYVIGGRSANLTGQTSAIRGVDPRTGRVYRAGWLPHPLSDAAAVADGRRILVLGGRDTSGVRGEVMSLEPKP